MDDLASLSLKGGSTVDIVVGTHRLLGKDVVQGTDPEKSVVKSLLARPLAEQPRDFQALVGLLTARLRSTT